MLKHISILLKNILIKFKNYNKSTVHLNYNICFKYVELKISTILYVGTQLIKLKYISPHDYFFNVNE